MHKSRVPGVRIAPYLYAPTSSHDCWGCGSKGTSFELQHFLRSGLLTFGIKTYSYNIGRPRFQFVSTRLNPKMKVKWKFWARSGEPP